MSNNSEDTAARKNLPKPIRFFLVEDSDVTRAALRAILSQNQDFELAGEAVDGKSAISRIMFAKPHIALIDVGLPGASGIEVTRELKSRSRDIKALMFTANEDDPSTFAAFAAGADGYVVKRDFEREILEKAIYSLMEGKCWLDPIIAKRILTFGQLNRFALPKLATVSVEPLTAQEKEDLASVESGQGECVVKPTLFARLQRFTKVFE